MELFRIGFLTITIIDVVDVLLVAILIYRLYVVMQGTIAVQIFIGLIVLVALSFVAQLFNLRAMTWLLSTVRDIWVIAFVVLFQPELRRFLTIVGRSPLVRMFVRLDVTETIDDIVAAVVELSRKKIGALIVITRATGIRMVIETGIPLQAKVSKQLLISIFNPKSPLHDGAVIIKDRIVEAAHCTLPLSTKTQHDGMVLGMRHLAAIGVTEQADVTVVVVSEETGTISIADNGILVRGLTQESLGQKLRSLLNVDVDTTPSTLFSQ
ncbi:MAG: diadenylate cyclase CdaA [Bacteroidota bacterium]